MIPDDIPAHLRSRVAVQPEADGCWLWAGSRTDGGYATAGGVRLHQLTFEIANGPIPDGLEPDHLCRTRWCINPAHMEAVTRRENTLRGDGPALLKARHAARTHCKRGHAFDEANTYEVPGRTTVGQTRAARACRRCRAEAAKLYRSKRKGGQNA